MQACLGFLRNVLVTEVTALARMIQGRSARRGRQRAACSVEKASGKARCFGTSCVLCSARSQRGNSKPNFEFLVDNNTPSEARRLNSECWSVVYCRIVPALCCSAVSQLVPPWISYYAHHHQHHSQNFLCHPSPFRDSRSSNTATSTHILSLSLFYTTFSCFALPQQSVKLGPSFI